MTQAHLEYSKLIRKVKLNLPEEVKVVVYENKITIKKIIIIIIKISKTVLNIVLSNSKRIQTAFQLTSL